MIDTGKYCANCKWVDNEYRDFCLHPVTSGGIDRVTGRPVGGKDCSAMREEGAKCGLEGKLFEQQPTIWQRIKQYFDLQSNNR